MKSLGLVFGLIAAISAFAGRPLTIDDSEPVTFRQFEFQAGVVYNGDGPIEHFDFPMALTYGVLPRLEIGAGSGGHIEEREEIESGRRVVTEVGDLTLGTKGKVLDAERWWADQALAFTVKIPTADCPNGLGPGAFDYDLTWIMSKPISDQWNTHLNVGYTWIGRCSHQALNDLLHYGVAADYQLTPAIQLVGELFANTPVDDARATPAILNGGARWNARDNLVFDAALGAGLSDGAPAMIVTVGLTWSFGKN